MVTVKKLAGDEWDVTVQGNTTTQHKVRVTDADLKRFAGGGSAEELLQESFRFLLEREPNTSILSSFDLPEINRYFPEYEGEIRQRVGRAR